MSPFSERYGPWALIAGASEGLGAAFAYALAARGLNLILVARRKEVLERTAVDITGRFGVQVKKASCDLALPEAAEILREATEGLEIGFLVYNAAYSHIGSFLSAEMDDYTRLSAVNVSTPVKLLHYFGGRMVDRRHGGVVLMSSIAGLQGAGFLAGYAATKAFTRVLAEGLWYEWKEKGVDVIACLAGATATPNYLETQPRQTSPMAPKPQLPEAVAEECLRRIGRVPSFISGRANRVASFFMQHILPRRMAIRIMGDTMRKMYDLK